MGRRGRPPVQEVPPQQPPGGEDAGPGPLPPLAREALRRRAAAGPVPHVHAVQGHERGLARATGHAVLQARDRSSPEETEAAAVRRPEENMRLADRGLAPRPNVADLKISLLAEGRRRRPSPCASLLA